MANVPLGNITPAALISSKVTANVPSDESTGPLWSSLHVILNVTWLAVPLTLVGPVQLHSASNLK